MDCKVSFLYLSEPDMIKAGVTDMQKCIETMEDMLVTLKKVIISWQDKITIHTEPSCHSQIIRSFRECRRMRMTGGLWQCRHIWEEKLRWQA